MLGAGPAIASSDLFCLRHGLNSEEKLRLAGSMGKKDQIQTCISLEIVTEFVLNSSNMATGTDPPESHGFLFPKLNRL